MGPKNRDPKISMKQVANIWEIDGTLDLKRILIPSIFIIFLANGNEAPLACPLWHSRLPEEPPGITRIQYPITSEYLGMITSIEIETSSRMTVYIYIITLIRTCQISVLSSLDRRAS